MSKVEKGLTVLFLFLENINANFVNHMIGMAQIWLGNAGLISVHLHKSKKSWKISKNNDSRLVASIKEGQNLA